jgi:hypothetical protein
LIRKPHGDFLISLIRIEHPIKLQWLQLGVICNPTAVFVGDSRILSYEYQTAMLLLYH